MVESALQGASGIAFWPWGYLGDQNLPGDKSSSVERVDMSGMTIRALTDSGIFSMLPQPTIAVLYQPYAEGLGAVSQVYGLLKRPTNEPLPLFRELRFGTKYGQVAYLTEADMGNTNLSRYGVILAPFSANIPVATQKRLERYVRNGGVLLADVGYAALQNNSITDIPDSAKELFGLESITTSSAQAKPYMATQVYEKLFGEPPVGETTTSRLGSMALDVTPSTAELLLEGPGKQGIYINKVGKGYALFCQYFIVEQLHCE